MAKWKRICTTVIMLTGGRQGLLYLTITPDKINKCELFMYHFQINDSSFQVIELLAGDHQGLRTRSLKLNWPVLMAHIQIRTK